MEVLRHRDVIQLHLHHLYTWISINMIRIHYPHLRYNIPGRAPDQLYISVYPHTCITVYPLTRIPVYLYNCINVLRQTSIPVYQYTTLCTCKCTVYLYTRLHASCVPVYLYTRIPVFVCLPYNSSCVYYLWLSYFGSY